MTAANEVVHNCESTDDVCFCTSLKSRLISTEQREAMAGVVPSPVNEASLHVLLLPKHPFSAVRCTACLELVIA